jgi:hypothetical protein
LDQKNKKVDYFCIYKSVSGVQILLKKDEKIFVFEFFFKSESVLFGWLQNQVLILFVLLRFGARCKKGQISI